MRTNPVTNPPFPVTNQGEAAELSAQRDDALGRRDARALAVARPVALAGVEFRVDGAWPLGEDFGPSLLMT